MLEQLMLQKLLAHHAVVDSIVVSDAEVNSQVERNIQFFSQEYGSIEKVVEAYGFNDIEDLKTQKYDDSQTKKWVHWVGQFKDKISNLQKGDLTMDERKSFLDGILKKIIVRTVDKKTHSLELVFKKHYVNDGFEWIDPKVKSKGYNLFNGKKSLKTVLGVEYNNQKKTQKTIK